LGETPRGVLEGLQGEYKGASRRWKKPPEKLGKKSSPREKFKGHSFSGKKPFLRAPRWGLFRAPKN